MMACTTSIGPGATNMITAAATAHLNRLPVLLLPGDVFASRFPDRSPAGRRFFVADRHRQRLLQARVALLGPHRSPEQLLTSLRRRCGC